MSEQPARTSLTTNEEVWSGASLRSDLDAAEMNIVFRAQPKSILARHRLAYRTALVVLVLSRFNQGAARLTNLHTLMWATRSTRTRQMYRAWWDGRRFYFTSTDRIDPDLQITLNLALVDGLIEPGANNARVRLAEKGRLLAQRIDDVEDLLAVEKSFLDGLGRLSDAAIERRIVGTAT